MPESVDLYLPLTTDGDRTFQVTLGSATFAFRSYYTLGIENFWLLDIYTIEGTPLALGRRLVAGSINLLKGFANELDNVAVTVLTDFADAENAPESPGATLHVVWYPDKDDNPFTDGDPMLGVLEQFGIAQV